MLNAEQQITDLPIWNGPIAMEKLGGGITNVNYVVSDSAARYVVRLGSDIGEHLVMRFNELAASRAAHAAGLSPRVVYHAPGILVLDYIASKTLSPEDIREPKMLARILPLIKSCHRDIPDHLRGPALIFWVFHVLRDYAGTLRDGNSSHLAKLTELMQAAKRLETLAGPIDVVFGHNDLLAANILDDGKRLWLIDWDYAGFNSPLFDLGGLVSNNDLTVAQENWLLETYFETPLNDELLARYRAMKCASLLRETMWSMVSELHSTIDFDFAQYTATNLVRFQRAYQDIN